MWIAGLYFSLILSLAGLLAFQLFKRKRLDRNQYEELYNVFDNYPIKPPILEIQKIRWWPTFTVTFLDKSDYEYARDNGLLETYNNRIQKRFYDKGFPAELAITYRWMK